MAYTVTTRSVLLRVDTETEAARKARALGAPGVIVQVRDPQGQLVDLPALLERVARGAR